MTNRMLSVIIICVMMVIIITPNAHAARARVTDAMGQTYDVDKTKLFRGKELRVICGSTRISVPFKRIRNMTIDPSQITPVDGTIYFGVEIHMGDEGGSTIGDIEDRGRCLIYSGNGLRGRVARAAYRIPFSDIRAVEILGKEKEEAATSDGDDDDEEED